MTTNQVGALASAGFFSNPPAHPHGLRALAGITNDAVSRTYRVRSYLEANCAQCHQPAGNVFSTWDARARVPLSQAAIIHGALANNPGGGDDKVISPGSIPKSAILKRMTSTGSDRMPPLGSTVIDQAGVDLIAAWVTQDLPAFESYPAWATRTMGSSEGHPATADDDQDGALNFAEYLMNTTPTQVTIDNPPCAEPPATRERLPSVTLPIEESCSKSPTKSKELPGCR